ESVPRPRERTLSQPDEKHVIEPNRTHGRGDVTAVRRTCLTDGGMFRLTPASRLSNTVRPCTETSLNGRDQS
ncbi:MAG TPA: hypothetical protein VHS97_09530, partial [Isosphaeraceae bacterium]|nr:hypothetical protein [Isosphaeraceae bacterium]